MAKIPEVGILSFWNLTSDTLPDNALSGQIIIVQETQDMYVGTGPTTPLLKVSDLSTVSTVEDLEDKNNGIIILYIVSSTNEIYFFYNNELRKCNGIGIAGVYTKYSNLPSSNIIDGLFCVIKDETNNEYPTLYAYTKDAGYLRLHHSDFDSNAVYRIKINNQYISAAKANNELNIITDNTLYTSVNNNVITINQKIELPNTIRREQIPMISGTIDIFPEDNLTRSYSTIVNDEMYIIGFSTSIDNSFVNKVYKYNKNDGWKLLLVDQIPYANLNGANFCVITYNNKIYVFGGYHYYRTSCLNILYEFDPSTLTFSKKADMPRGRADCAYGVIDNKLWVIGGRILTGGTYTQLWDTCYYDFESDTWTTLSQVGNTPIPFFAGAYFTYNNELHFIHITNSRHVVFNTDTLTWSNRNNAPFADSWTGSVRTSNNTIYCITRYGIIYSYNPITDIWLNCGTTISKKGSAYLNIDSNDTIYNLGYYTSNSISRELELLQPIRVYVDNDCQIIMRQPINKNLQYEGNIYRSVTVEKGKYVEYIGYSGDTTLDLIIKDFTL